MGQIISPIIGITLVLIAVFVPMAFFPGSTGGIYREFSVTWLFRSPFLRAARARTLDSPALCATFLSHPSHSTEGGLFAASTGLRRTTVRYEGRVPVHRRPKRWLAIYAARRRGGYSTSR
jgi:multidrug efflux pump